MKNKKAQPRVQQKTSIPDSRLSFSFKYLDLDSDPHFSLSYASANYTEKLLLRLRDVSGLSVSEFMISRSLRSHEIVWSKTARPNGFVHLNEQLQGETAWQFALSSNEYGRVHGLLIDDVFYVVWLDPGHKLFP